MIRYILASLLIITLIRPFEAQGQSSAARRLFEHYQYAKALEAYLKLSESDNARVDVIEGVADCYRMLNNNTQAAQWYSRAAGLQGAKPIDTYFYAEALLKTGDPIKAKVQFKSYFEKNGTKELLDSKLASCDTAISWIKHPGTYKLTNEDKINTSDSEWGLNYAGKTGFVYTSDRSLANIGVNKIPEDHKGIAWLKLFNYDPINKFTDEVKFDQEGIIKLNRAYHTGPMAVNASGDTAYITVTTRERRKNIPNDHTETGERIYTRRLELIMAVKKGDKWTGFTRFPYDNVDAYSVGHAALTRNGQILYFTSDMPGGYGQTDIWYCQRLENGTWSHPVNCGPNVNTAGQEAFPTVGEGDKLYFSSNGLPGMGGLDIFSVKGTGAIWSTPVNLKFPLNSPGDDFYLTTQDGITGYISSNREGGKGSDDIYSFVNTAKAEPVKKIENRIVATTPVPVTAPPAADGVAAMPQSAPADALNVEGVIFDSDTNKGIDSVAVYLKTIHGETLANMIVPANQKFTFKVIRGQRYILEGRKKGYYPATQYIDANGKPANFSMKIEHLEIGRTFIIRDIYYDLNRANIRKDAEVEMERLVTLMKENPTLRIELSSHTDSRGSDYYNMLLSQARAISAVAYIKRHGIAADRMIAKGYGETRLLNKCANGVKCSEEDHQLNRRTEIKVIGGNFKK